MRCLLFLFAIFSVVFSFPYDVLAASTDSWGPATNLLTYGEEEALGYYGVTIMACYSKSQTNCFEFGNVADGETIWSAPASSINFNINYLHIMFNNEILSSSYTYRLTIRQTGNTWTPVNTRYHISMDDVDNSNIYSTNSVYTSSDGKTLYIEFNPPSDNWGMDLHITTTSNYFWGSGAKNFTILNLERKIGSSSGIDTGVSDPTDEDIISNANKNTEEIINNQNGNTQTIVDKLEEQEETSKGIWQTIKDIFVFLKELPSKLVNLLLDGLKSLFIPDSDELSSIMDNFKATMSEKLGVIYQVGDLLIGIFQDIMSDTQEADSCLTFPSLSIPNVSTPIFEEQEWCFSSITDKIPILLTTIRGITGILITIAFVNMLKKKYDDFINGGNL